MATNPQDRQSGQSSLAKKETLLFTGASGFLGRNTIPLLRERYAITTLGRSQGNGISTDLSKEQPPLTTRFDLVMHAAGKAHDIPYTASQANQFFDVNVQGTINLCHALERVGVPRALVYISSVAVYGGDEGKDITEDAPLAGTIPYAKSKIQAEQFLQQWCREHNVALGILRPALIVGSNPRGNLRAMIQGIRAGRYVHIAGGHARKSALMASDIAQLFPLVVENPGIYNICDDTYPSFAELGQIIARELGRPEPRSIPYWLAYRLAKIGLNCKMVGWEVR
ncbi:MAG: NAD(P)-dependent oxidoreductase [Bacteroidales bacterium]|nr:NAD(P)-dependent oxidoreductase [Bacteroidales bacterium]